MTATAHPAVPGYDLLQTLGRGACGTVVAGRRRSDGAAVAVKLLRPGLCSDHEFAARFRREAALASRIDHPNLVPVIEAGGDEQQLYLVAELLTGGSLRDRLRSGTPPELAATAAALGAALACIHRQGVVHRDLKPSNVLFDAAGKARVTDFGLAKQAASVVLTRTGQLLGTPAYMAPELVEGAPATEASDVYAMACVVFECATGLPPFHHGSAMQVALDHVCSPPPDPRSLAPELPEGLAGLLLVGLAKRPQERPTAADYGRSLADAVTLPATT
jgi:serine/threonine protein kinase